MQTALQFIGLFLILILSFFGANYIFEGDYIIPGFIAVVLVTFMYFLIEFLKKRKIQVTKNKFSSLSILLWLLFVIICLPIGFLTIHALNVEINAKKDLQDYADNIVFNNKEAINVFQSESNQYIEETYLLVSNLLNTYVNTNSKKDKDSIGQVLQGYPFYFSELEEITKSNYLNLANSFQSALEIKSSAVLDSVTERTNTTIKTNLPLIDTWSRLRVLKSIGTLEDLFQENVIQLDHFLRQENQRQDLLYNTFGKESTEPLNFIKGDDDKLRLITTDINLADPVFLWNLYKPFWLFIPVLIFFLFLILPFILLNRAGDYLSENETISNEGGIEI